MTADSPVTFLNSRGEEISNDPRWHAAQTLKATGVDVDDLQSQIAKLTAERDAALAKHASSAGVEENATEAQEEVDSAAAEEEGDEYDQLNGKELKALANERGVDITGMKKVGEVREALRAADAASGE